MPPKEVWYSANPGEDIEGGKLRLPGDLAIVKGAKEIPDVKAVDSAENSLSESGNFE